MADACISHGLSLALRLLDTTTGLPVPLSDVTMEKGMPRPREADTGTLLYIDLPREDFRLQLRSRRYEDCAIEVRFSELDEKLPILDLPLVPRAGLYGGDPLFSLDGVLPGLTELSAVRPSDTNCLFREFDEKKRLLTIFNPHAHEFARPHYALVDTEAARFEFVRILKRVNDTTLKLENAPVGTYGNYSPLTPVVEGVIRPDGGYAIRFRDDGGDAKWILRYVADGEEHFKTADFRSGEELTL